MCFFCCSKTCLTLAISRIKLLQNKRDGQLKLMRKEIAQFLQSGQEPIARIRVCLFVDTWSVVLLFVAINFHFYLFFCIHLLGGACYTGTEYMGRLWSSRDVLWICPCPYSNHWNPKVCSCYNSFSYFSICKSSITHILFCHMSHFPIENYHDWILEISLRSPKLVAFPSSPIPSQLFPFTLTSLCGLVGMGGC